MALSACLSRGRCCGVPASAVPLNAKLASRNALGRTFACLFRAWKVSQSFQLCSGSDADQSGELGDRVRNDRRRTSAPIRAARRRAARPSRAPAPSSRARRGSTPARLLASPRSPRASRAPVRSWSRARRSAARRLRVGIVGELQELRDIGLILGPELGHLGIGGQIIFALGQADAALHQIGQLLARRRQPLGDEDSEQILGVEIGRVERVGVGADLCCRSRC